MKVITLDADIKGKTKDGASFSYKGVSSAQVVTFAKSALLANGIVFYPVMKRDGVQVTGNKTAVYIDGHFVSVDDGEDRIVTGAWGSRHGLQRQGLLQGLHERGEELSGQDAGHVNA